MRTSCFRLPLAWRRGGGNGGVFQRWFWLVDRSERAGLIRCQHSLRIVNWDGEIQILSFLDRGCRYTDHFTAGIKDRAATAHTIDRRNSTSERRRSRLMRSVQVPVATRAGTGTQRVVADAGGRRAPDSAMRR